jgi:hypothetical protein
LKAQIFLIIELAKMKWETLALGYDGTLESWDDRDNRTKWSGILIGNGASIAVWDQFIYSSIYEIALTDQITHPLSPADQALFAAFDNTINFEQILSALATARKVNLSLGMNIDLIQNRYQSIQTSLIETIHKLHVPWTAVPTQTLETIGTELRNYKYVYSTNYDLLIYWAVMQAGPNGFVDYFFQREFDLEDTDVIDENCTRVLYLHGGLHLYRLPTGVTLKRRQGAFQNLLNVFGTPVPYYPDAVPLFITEGEPSSKLNSINQSQYLAFAFREFMEHKGNLVVFGHSLSDYDDHIVKAINSWGPRRLAIGLLPSTALRISRQKTTLLAKLPETEVFFFDATTHPLGSAALKVQPY